MLRTSKGWLYRLAWLGLLLCCLGSAPGRLLAAEEQRPRALILVGAAGDRALVERVRGQVSDLDLELVVVEADPTRAASLVLELHAVAVVWFTRADAASDRVVVHAASRGQKPERVLVRELGDGATTPNGAPTSATLEASALVVREALIDFTSREPDPAPPPATPAKVTVSPPRLRQPSTEHLYFRGEIGWQAVLDGVGVRLGPSFALGARYRALELAGFACTSLPATEHDRFGTIRLRRHAFGLRGMRHWALSQTSTLELGLSLGLALYARGVQQLEGNVIPQGDRLNPSVLFGPEARLGWAPGGGALEIGVNAGLGVLPGAPRIGYQLDGRFEPSFVLWRLQPTFGIGLKFVGERRR